MNKPKVIALDLDGTLAESKSPIAPEMADLFSKLLDKYKVIVISGGNYEQFQTQLLAHLPTNINFQNLTLITDSGGETYVCETSDCQIRHSSPMSPDDKVLINKAIDEALAEVSWPLPNERWGERVQDRGSEITLSVLGQQAPLEKKKTWDPEHTKRAELARIIRAKLPDLEVHEGGMTSVDITPMGTNKKSALEQYILDNSITSGEIVYVGDALFPGGNDSIVKELISDCRQVSGPEETAVIIESLINE